MGKNEVVVDNLVLVDKVITKGINSTHSDKVTKICARLEEYIVEHIVDKGIWTTLIYAVNPVNPANLFKDAV